MITLLPIPFGRERARKAAHRHTLINLALTILRLAAMRSATEAVGTIEVRLALHVLRPYVRDQALLTKYWRAATIQLRHPWTSCQLPYRYIVRRLVENGESVENGNLP